MVEGYDWIRDAVMGILVPSLVYLFLRTQKLDVQVALNRQSIEDGARHHENELTQFRGHLEKIERSLESLGDVIKDGMSEMRKSHETSQSNFNTQMARLARDIMSVAAGHNILKDRE